MHRFRVYESQSILGPTDHWIYDSRFECVTWCVKNPNGYYKKTPKPIASFKNSSYAVRFLKSLHPRRGVENVRSILRKEMRKCGS